MWNKLSLSPARLWPQLTALLLIAVELCWVVPWYRTLMEIGYVASPFMNVLALGGVMLSAFIAAQVLESLRLLRNIQLGVLGLLLIFDVVAGGLVLLNTPSDRLVGGFSGLTPSAVLLLFPILWLWWRGIGMAREPIRPSFARRRFLLALLMILAHVLIVSRVRGEPVGIGLFVLFLLVGLTSVIFARIAFVSIAHHVTKNPFDRRWLGSTVLILGATVAAASILGSLLTGQYLLLFDVLANLIRLVAASLIFILGIPGLLLSNLFGPLLAWLMGLPQRQNPAAIPDELFSPDYRPLVGQQPISPEFQNILFWGFIVLLLVIILLRLRSQMANPRREELDDLESLLDRGEGRRLLRKAMQAALNDLANHLRPARRVLAAARIRRIYAELLDLCTQLNEPRPEANTPLQFLPKMGELFPAYTAGLERITDAYTKVRYGELPEDPRELVILEEDWKNIAAEGRRMKRAGQHKLKTAELEEMDQLRRQQV